MKKIILLSFILIVNLQSKAQDIAMLSSRGIYTHKEAKHKIVPMIDKAEFVYKYDGSEVIVSFNGDQHIEYHQNKKYQIKSKIEWISSDECYLTIQESNLFDFPFKRGAKLHFKILKIKRGKVFYQSTLRGRSWEGTMKTLQ